MLLTERNKSIIWSYIRSSTPSSIYLAGIPGHKEEEDEEDKKRKSFIWSYIHSKSIDHPPLQYKATIPDNDDGAKKTKIPNYSLSIKKIPRNPQRATYDQSCALFFHTKASQAAMSCTISIFQPVVYHLIFKLDQQAPHCQMCYTL